MRKPARANDYITRAECQALIVHSLNDFLAQVAKEGQHEMPDDYDCPHCHGTQMVGNDEGGPDTGCVCLTRGPVSPTVPASAVVPGRARAGGIVHGMKTLRLALALTVACAAPTAPEHYEGACTLAIPRAQPLATFCYTQCPWHTETFAAEGDGAFAKVTSCS